MLNRNIDVPLFSLIKSLFVSLKSYGWKYCLLIRCERKTLFRLKNKLKSMDYKTNEQDLKEKVYITP
jgi:hypothetical protein